MDQFEGQISVLKDEKKKTEETLMEEKQERVKDTNKMEEEIGALKNELEMSKQEIAQVHLLVGPLNERERLCNGKERP